MKLGYDLSGVWRPYVFLLLDWMTKGNMVHSVHYFPSYFQALIFFFFFFWKLWFFVALNRGIVRNAVHARVETTRLRPHKES
uniref:Uncharacterized protein n=1 Tax=Ixodes ricinus TaxID=34613 RepID=A0A6B0U8N8_IXORI